MEVEPMPTIRLTKNAIGALPFEAQGQKIYRDDQLPGFGLVVGSKSKSCIVEARVGGKNVRCTVGRATLLSAEVARRKAKALLGEMAEGRNPNAKKKAQSADELTLEQAFVSFRSARNLAATSLDCYNRSVNLCFADWKTKPLAKISRDMVLARHQRLAEERGRDRWVHRARRRAPAGTRGAHCPAAAAAGTGWQARVAGGGLRPVAQEWPGPTRRTLGAPGTRPKA
jgi:hypothetical protein